MKSGEGTGHICSNKFYDFFALMYDTKILTPFSQFIDGSFLTEFKKKIKEQLNDTQSSRSKSIGRTSVKGLELPIKESKRAKTKPRNSNVLIRGAETEIKETSRFGTTPVEEIKNAYNGRNKSKLESESAGKQTNNDNTLSLSYIGNTNDQNYVIYDSAYGYNYGYKARKMGIKAQKRIKKY